MRRFASWATLPQRAALSASTICPGAAGGWTSSAAPSTRHSSSRTISGATWSATSFSLESQGPRRPSSFAREVRHLSPDERSSGALIKKALSIPPCGTEFRESTPRAFTSAAAGLPGCSPRYRSRCSTRRGGRTSGRPRRSRRTISSRITTTSPPRRKL